MDQHHSRVWELVQNPDLGLSDVYSRVLVGLLARQPIEADLFPGILEGLAGNLGLSPAGTVDPPRSRQEGVMRRWATTLRQAASDPPIQDRDPPQARLPWGSPRLQHGVPVTKSRRHPTSVDVVTIVELPFLEKPKTGAPPSPPAAQQPEETDSPQSPLPDEEGEVEIQPHQQKMLVQFPFQKKKVVGLRRTPSKESTGRFGVSSDKEDDSVVTVSDDGSDPNGASTSTGRTIPSSRKNGVGRANHSMRHLRRNQQTTTRLHPNRIRARLPKQQRPFSLQQGMSYTARTIRLSRRYGPVFSGWTLT